MLLAALAFGVFANTLANGFVNDDEHQVLLNPWIRDPGSIPEILSGSVWGFLHGPTRTDYYRPVMHLVYLANTMLFGLNAWGFHLTNALLHVVNTLLVFALADRAARAGNAREGPPARGFVEFVLAAPFAAAALFAVHPVHAEAVAWVASVPELTYSMFCLAALLVLGEEAVGRSRALSLGLFCAALLAKETAVTFPGLIVAWELSRPASVRRTAREVATRLAPYLAAIGIYLLVRHRVLAAVRVPLAKIWDLGPLELAAAGVRLLGDYLGMLLLPVQLSFWHPFPPPEPLLSLRGAAALVVVGAFAVALWAAWRRRGPELFALLLFAVPLAPAFYIAGLPGKVFAERYLYLPSAGLCLLAAMALSRMAARPRLRWVAAGIFLVTVTLLATATISRNRVWKDSFTLYVDTAAKSKDTPTPPPSLAKTLLERGRPAEAVALLRILADVEPGNASHHSSLGGALIANGNLDEGIAHLRRALGLEPRSLETLNDLAIALRRQGRVEEAVALYRRALEIDPKYADAHFNLGGVLTAAGRRGEALEHYRAAVAARPENAYFHAVLGIECAEQGRLDEAIAQFEEAVRLAPEEAAYRRNLERARGLMVGSRQNPQRP